MKKVCPCCLGEMVECLKGFCNKCYLAFKKKGILGNDLEISKHSKVFRLKNIIGERAFTYSEIRIILSAIDSGLIPRMFSGMWSSKFSHTNAINFLSYWCLYEEKYDLYDLPSDKIMCEIKAKLVNSPLAILVSPQFKFKTLYLEMLESFGEALVI